jgi:hypothetical protein
MGRRIPKRGPAVKPFVVVFTIVVLLSGVAFWRNDFSIDKIQIPLLSERDPYIPMDFEWPKKFQYLNQGAQVFAFESEDGKYVLKFFKRDQLKIPKFIRQKNKIRRLEKIRIYRESYRLAFELLREETGLLAVHQGISSLLYPKVEVINQASRSFLIDLNTIPFVLQKKGIGTLMGRFLMDQSKLPSFFDAFFSFHAKRIRCRVADGDRDIKRNYAWIEDSFLYIDPARFFYEEKLAHSEPIRREWWKATHRVRRWICKNSPDLLALFDAKADEYLRSLLMSGK